MPVLETSNHKTWSDWFDLEEGQFYKIQGYQMQYTGGESFTVAVEFE